jgi:acetyl esterase/lipase
MQSSSIYKDTNANHKESTMTNQNESANSKTQDNSWQIGPRTLPAPSGASDVLYNIISNTPTPVPTINLNLVPRTESEWRAAITQLDEGKVDMAREISKQLSVSVEHGAIEGVSVYYVTPVEVAPDLEDKLFVHTHGGAFVLNGGEAGTIEAIVIAALAKVRVLSIDYRMPPSHPAPAARDDVVTVYQHLLKQGSAQKIALGGSSGGANLTMGLVQHFIEQEVDLPGALFLGTPGADMSKTGDSYYINDGIDRNLVTYDGFLEAAVRLYANGRDLKDPLVSPLYGDLHGFPPTFLITGTRDLLLSATVRTHIKLRQSGVVADLFVYEGIAHGDYAVDLTAPETQHAFAELNAFLLQHLR